MEKLIIKNVTYKNQMDVLKKLEAHGVRWACGDKPTESPHSSSVYTVGVFRDDTLTFGNPGPHFYDIAKTITADEFVKSYAFNQIVITRKGRQVTATDQDGNHASARCCPEDDFDFYEGARLALERLEEKTHKIKEGDVVRIINPGKAFTTLTAAYFTTDDELRRYVFGLAPKEGYDYVVKRVGYDDKLYIDGGMAHSGLYVIGLKGVERVKK